MPKKQGLVLPSGKPAGKDNEKLNHETSAAYLKFLYHKRRIPFRNFK